MNCKVGRSARLAVVVLMVVGSATWAAAQNAPMLRYGFQAGRQYAYEVKIYADLDDEEETREGVLTYAVLSATDQQAVLKQTGNLAKQTKLKPGRMKAFTTRGFSVAQKYARIAIG